MSEGDKRMRAQRAEKVYRKNMKAESEKCPVCGYKLPGHFLLCPKVKVD